MTATLPPEAPLWIVAVVTFAVVWALQWLREAISDRTSAGEEK